MEGVDGRYNRGVVIHRGTGQEATCTLLSLFLSVSLPSSLFLLLRCLTTKSLPLNRDNYRGNDKLFSRFDLLANRLGSLINRRFNETSEKTREGYRTRRSSRRGDSNWWSNYHLSIYAFLLRILSLRPSFTFRIKIFGIVEFFYKYKRYFVSNVIFVTAWMNWIIRLDICVCWRKIRRQKSTKMQVIRKNIRTVQSKEIL